MEFRTQAAAGLILALAIPAAGAEYPVRHDHLRKWCEGVLVIGERGVSYQETVKKKQKKPHSFQWDYRDIQQLVLSPEKVQILTYEDQKWKLGADRSHEFRIAGQHNFLAAYEMLKDRLDQRLVAALADLDAAPLWEMPVKLLGRIQGSEGVLLVGRERIVYKTEAPGSSRTWRYEDIESVSSFGPFQLTLTTFERATTHYGNRKSFNFQLKEALSEGRYDGLWRRLNQTKLNQEIEP